MKTRGFKKARKLVQSDAAQKILNILVCCALVLQTSPLAYARPGEETPEQQQEVVLQEEASAQDPTQETEGTTDEQNAPTVPEETSAENTAPQATDGLQESTDPAPTAPVQGQPAANTQQTFIHEDGSLRVTATLSDPSALPAGVVFRVKRVTSDTRGYSYNAYMQALNDRAREQAQAEGVSVDEAPVYTPDNTMLYDAGFFMKDANGTWVEVQLASGTVNLTFEFKRDQLSEGIGAADAQDIEVVHLPLVPEVRDAVASTAQATQASAEDVVVEAPVAGSVAVDAASDTASFALTSLSMIAVGAAGAPAADGSLQVTLFGYKMAGWYKGPTSPSIPTGSTRITITDPENMAYGFGEGQALRKAYMEGYVDQKVVNRNMALTWVCVGFIPRYDTESNPDRLFRNYCFEKIADAEAFVERNNGVLYGEVPSEEMIQALYSARYPGLMTIWAYPPIEVKRYDYDDLTITGATPVDYQPTTSGIEETAITTTTYDQESHASATTHYTYVIPEGFDEDIINLNIRDLLPLSEEEQAGLVVHGLQPGDDNRILITIIDKSGNEYELIEGSGAVGTSIDFGSTSPAFGFEGYGIPSTDQMVEHDGVHYAVGGRRSTNQAIRDLYKLAGFSKWGSWNAADFLAEATARAPHDQLVGAALYLCGYGDGPEDLAERAANVGRALDENYNIIPFNKSTGEDFSDYAQYLDEYYLDWMNANYYAANPGNTDNPHWTSFTDADRVQVTSLFSSVTGTQIYETNPVAANLLYYGFYNYLYTVSDKAGGTDTIGFYDLQSQPYNQDAEGNYLGNAFSPKFEKQWKDSASTDSTANAITHDLAYFLHIAGTDADNAVQDTMFYACAQIKLKRSIKISLNKYYAGSDAQEGMFNFLVSPANENFEVETGGTQSKTATNGAFDETTHIAPVSQTIDCSEKKVYYYVISEQNPNQALRDPAEILVKVDNTVEKGPKITYAIREANGTVGEFSETLPTLYNNSKIKVAGRARKLRGATNFTAYQPEIRKVLEYGTLKGDDFNFSLYEGTEVDESKLLDTETNDVTGKVAFAAMNFGDGDVGKTFTYTIVENAPAGATTNDDGQVVSQGIVYTQDQVRLTLEVTRDKEGNIKVEDTYELISAETGEASETDDPCLVNTYEQVVVLAHKYTRVDGKADKSMPLVGAHYQLYMVNPGGADIALTEGRNQLEVEGCRYESAEDGSLYYDIPLVEGVAYYFKELDPPPAGHLVDPYPTDYFTLVRTDDGFKLVYESEFGSTEEFLAYVESINS